ncbi:MAG: PKD domain-containing protein, partial [Bdellovibrionales bacterium]
MKNRALIILCGSLSLFSLGCQKTGGGASNSPKAAPLSNALSCDVGQAMAKVDSKKLKIESSGPARPGEVVHYKINQDLNCAAKAVTWDIEPSRAPALKSDKMRSVYSWPGEYVVTAKVQTAGEPISLSVRTLVSDEISLSGPQIGMAELDHHFELVVPASLPVENISWNFGDDTDPEAGMGPKDHFYYQPGDYQVIVTITMTDSSTATIVHPIKVIPATDGMECVRDLVISGPSDLMPGQVGTFTAFLPPCLANRVRQVRWNFGDGSLMMAGTSLTHAYDLPGNYTVRVDLFSGENPTPLLTIHRSVFVPAEPTPDPDPIPDPTPEPDPDPTPAICKVGDTRQSDGNTSTEKRECGVGGTKDVTIKERIVEECKLIGGEVPGWMEVSRTREVIGEGECTGQYCELPPGALEGVDAVSGDFFNIGGKWYLPSGITKTFYSNRSPAGSCSEVSERRTCTNGVFSGTSDHVYLSCHNGCEGMGPHGTTKTDVVIGQETVPKMCRFGETGVTDIFQTIADKTCNEGTVETSNTHRGGLLVAGECPTYSWVPTENWTACSADCGGEQKRIYECRSSKGEVAPAERCENAAPVQVRVCDGNPEAVRRSETSTEVEDAGSSGKCPANQIGYTISRREVKTTTTYACIDHSVQSEGTNVETGPWVEEKYCKDYAPHRCSKDPLMTTEETRGRFAWMKKCAPSNAAIREFLDVYDHTGGYLKD